MAVPRPREGGLRRANFFWLRLTAASAQRLHLSERFFIIIIIIVVVVVVVVKWCT